MSENKTKVQVYLDSGPIEYIDSEIEILKDEQGVELNRSQFINKLLKQLSGAASND